jgi:hypothetical protein
LDLFNFWGKFDFIKSKVFFNFMKFSIKVFDLFFSNNNNNNNNYVILRKDFFDKFSLKENDLFINSANYKFEEIRYNQEMIPVILYINYIIYYVIVYFRYIKSFYFF